MTSDLMRLIKQINGTNSTACLGDGRIIADAIAERDGSQRGLQFSGKSMIGLN